MTLEDGGAVRAQPATPSEPAIINAAASQSMSRDDVFTIPPMHPGASNVFGHDQRPLTFMVADDW